MGRRVISRHLARTSQWRQSTPLPLPWSVEGFDPFWNTNRLACAAQHPHPARRTPRQGVKSNPPPPKQTTVQTDDSLYTGVENTSLFFLRCSHFNMVKFIRVSVTVAFSWRKMARFSRFQSWFYCKYNKSGKISNYRVLRVAVFEKTSAKRPGFRVFWRKAKSPAVPDEVMFLPVVFPSLEFSRVKKIASCDEIVLLLI